MSEETPRGDAPEIEDLIAELRRDLDAARDGDGSRGRGPHPEEGLATSLAMANGTFLVGSATRPGLRGLRDRAVRAVLRGLLSEINGFHAHVVRTLNGLAATLAVQDFAARDARIGRLGERLAEYDALDLEARLRRVEERLAAMEGRQP